MSNRVFEGEGGDQDFIDRLASMSLSFEGDEVVVTERRDGKVVEHVRLSHDAWRKRVLEGLLIAEQGASFEGN